MAQLIACPARFRYGPRMPQSRRDTRDFGYEDVTPDEHRRRVKGVFDSVATRYDLMNDLMSGGIHRLWKAELRAQLRPRPGATLVDVGGGTGDIALGYLGRAKDRAWGRVVVVDMNHEMLTVGRDRALDKGIVAGPLWVAGTAEDLPLPDSSVEAYVTAFCLRNVTDLRRALAEARRVLRPTGKFLCLEFSRVAVPALQPLYDAYSFAVLPLLGQIVAGDAESYRYLAESIRRFPSQQDFAAMIAEAGLGTVRWRNLTGGIAAIHSAIRL
jgi:demethylmenaquinone methyltransferase/2-methoxy-6-polyprenyl-1,4-benzoquinol methylase